MRWQDIFKEKFVKKSDHPSAPDMEVLRANPNEVISFIEDLLKENYLKVTIPCPMECGGIMKLNRDVINLTIKGDPITHDQYFYHCDKCNESWTTEESDTQTSNLNK